MVAIFCIVHLLSTNVLTANPLSDLATKYKTDKGPVWHNYTELYHQYFAPLKNKPIKFLEIGFWHGSSARMWAEYFPNAELHFIDIDKKYFEKYDRGLSQRCHFHVLDQSDPDQLKSFLDQVGSDFDIIIDDGGHSMIQQITSFKYLFAGVKAGGIYVVEDLFSSYIESWRTQYYGGLGTQENPKAGPGTTIQFLKDRLDDLNYAGSKTRMANRANHPESLAEEFNYFQRYIQSMHFYDLICFIIKRKT